MHVHLASMHPTSDIMAFASQASLSLMTCSERIIMHADLHKEA